jgi:hypothetical protein
MDSLHVSLIAVSMCSSMLECVSIKRDMQLVFSFVSTLDITRHSKYSFQIHRSLAYLMHVHVWTESSSPCNLECYSKELTTVM